MIEYLAAIPVLGGMFEKLGAAIDRNVTTDEERLKLKVELAALYGPVLQAVLAAQESANKLQMKIAEVEAQSEHFIVYARRPIIAFASVANFLWAAFYGHMDVTDAMHFAMLVNGLDVGTRGIEKVIGKLKMKEQI